MKKSVIFLIVVMCVLSLLGFAVVFGLLFNTLSNNKAIDQPTSSTVIKQDGSQNIFVPTYEEADADSLYAQSFLGNNTELFLQTFEWECIENEDEIVVLTWEEMKECPISKYALFSVDGAGEYEGLSAILTYDDDLAETTTTWGQCVKDGLCVLFVTMDADSPAAKTILHTESFGNMYNAILAQFGQPTLCDTGSSGDVVLIYSCESMVATIGVLNSDDGGIDISMLAGPKEEQQ